MAIAFRVLKPYPFRDCRGDLIRPAPQPGDLVDIRTRQEVKSLMAAGVIGPSEQSARAVAKVGAAAKEMSRARRVGIWLVTSKQYSGGRIHMYQFAWTLANLGAEVFLITNRKPIWMKDYPFRENLRIFIDGQDKIPPDLDMIVTDSKGDLGRRALQYRRHHPHVPFICFNFETPNWPAHFVPNCDNPPDEALAQVHDYGGRLGSNLRPDVFRQAQFLVANSNESRKHMMKWMESDDFLTGVLPPAVNTFALALAISEPAKLPNPPDRPYAIYSARSAPYKGGDVAIEAVWRLDVPMDIVAFGTLDRPPAPTQLHRIHSFPCRGDHEKYTMLRGASMVLAPSLFEGYGMVPGEAICSGKPVITYDLPVLRQEYGDRLIYAEWGNRAEYCKKVREVATNPADYATSAAEVEECKQIYGMGAMERRIEKMPYFTTKRHRISAHLISYWGFMPESIESVYPYVDEIIVAHGPTSIASGIVAPDALSAKEGAASLKLLQEFPDPDNKIIIEARDAWRDKKVMRNWCCERATGNRMLVLDGDEIWVGLDKWLSKDIPFSSPRWLNFWHDRDHWIHDTGDGRRWGGKMEPYGSVCPHYRWSVWRHSYQFMQHPLAHDVNRKCIFDRSSIAAAECPEAMIYHLGHALTKELMEIKHEFYAVRDGRDAGRTARRNAWHRWSGNLGDCGDGIIADVNWELPEIVTRAFDGMEERSGGIKDETE